jgi:hypothetical protein
MLEQLTRELEVRIGHRCSSRRPLAMHGPGLGATSDRGPIISGQTYRDPTRRRCLRDGSRRWRIDPRYDGSAIRRTIYLGGAQGGVWKSSRWTATTGVR